MHSRSQHIKGHTQNGGSGNSSTCCHDSIDPRWAKKEVSVFFAPIKDRSHRCTDSCQFHAICYGATEESSFLTHSEKTIEEVLVVPFCLRWIHFISLHSSKYYFGRVCYNTSNHSSSNTSSCIVIRTSLSSWVRVNPIVEVKESHRSCCGI